MKYSTVNVFNNDIVRVGKDKCSVLIVTCGLFVVIVKEELIPSESIWVLNTYRAHDTGDAYNKWLHWIGKMCKKSITSKYFAGYETCPSFTNGYIPNDTEKEEILEDLRNKIGRVISADD